MEPRTIAIVNGKGGTGKSTVCQSLAVEWACRGYRVGIIDLDAKLQSSCKWREKRDEKPPEVFVQAMRAELTGGDFRQRFVGFAAAFDLVLIDTPGEIGVPAVQAMSKADFVLMPCGPNGIEVDGIAETLEELANVRDLRPDLRAAVLIAKKRAGTESARTARAAYEDEAVDVCETELDYYEDYDKAYKAGSGPTEWAPRGEAAAQVRALCDELGRRVKLRRASRKK